MVRRLAAVSIYHRRRVLAGWLLVLLAGFASAPLLFGRLSSETGTASGSESQRVAQLLHRVAPSGDEIDAVVDGLSASDPALRRDVDAAAADVVRLPGVASVATPWSVSGGPALVARDQQAIAVRVTFRPDRPGTGEVHASAARIRAIPAPRVVVGGGPLQDDEMSHQAAADLAHAEELSMPIVLVLLLVVFGSVVAAGLPLVLALVGVAATLLGLTVLSLLLDVSVYSVNVVTMLGLGLAVDYALLIVSRFREEQTAAPHDEPATLVERTLATAGRTVLFSGLTVAASLCCLLAFPDDFLRSMGLAGLTVVLLDMLAALTLLPALLMTAGHRIRPRRAERAAGTIFARIARTARRRPVLVLVVVTAALVLPALPFAGVHFTDADARSLPPSSASRQLYETATQRFAGVDATDPLDVVTDQPLDTTATAALTTRIKALGGVASIQVRRGLAGETVPGRTVLEVATAGTSQGPTAERLVREVRALGGLRVGGDTAELVDYTSALSARLPLAAAILLLVTFTLLFLFTGSVVVPLKAIVLNLLSLGAGFGALVWVFQEGHLGSLLGTEALGSLSITTPVLVFAIAFGLSMDYEVFLLGRITEEYRRTGDTDLAVERGLQRTGGIVTCAALLIVVVFAGFVTGGFSPIKQVGLGLALTVALDATLVRMLLLPAAMSLLGRANWWTPPPLRRLHQRIGLGEDVAVPRPRGGDRLRVRHQPEASARLQP
jgi:RND superfamily putative drug exporter